LPGFHRADGYAKSVPLCAMSLLARDPAWIPRLITLLNHPAYVVRVYAAKALGELRAEGAVEPIAKVLRDGYPFEDAIEHDSGKHGPDISRFVRWKGYLAMSLGNIGSERAREVLEQLVVDSQAPRDIRVGAAIGLGTVADRRSRGALTEASRQDIVRAVRQTARHALHEIDVAQQGSQP
ncbi:MAG: HEAT repeat domain-containing protein, partial [Pirellulales bacterium]